MARLGTNQGRAVLGLVVKLIMVDGDTSETSSVWKVLSPVFGESWRITGYSSYEDDVKMIKSFPLDKRKEVAACLAAVAAMDGKIVAAEKRFWEQVKKECNLPDWSISEALKMYEKLAK